MTSLLCNNKHHNVILGSNKFHLLSPLNCNVCLLFRTIAIVTMTIIKVMHAILGMIESGEKDHPNNDMSCGKGFVHFIPTPGSVRGL